MPLTNNEIKQLETAIEAMRNFDINGTIYLPKPHVVALLESFGTDKAKHTRFSKK